MHATHAQHTHHTRATRRDSWGRMMAPFTQRQVWMYTEGNHEIERAANAVPFLAYTSRRANESASRTAAPAHGFGVWGLGLSAQGGGSGGTPLLTPRTHPPTNPKRAGSTCPRRPAAASRRSTTHTTWRGRTSWRWGPTPSTAPAPSSTPGCGATWRRWTGACGAGVPAVGGGALWAGGQAALAGSTVLTRAACCCCFCLTHRLSPP